MSQAPATAACGIMWDFRGKSKLAFWEVPLEMSCFRLSNLTSHPTHTLKCILHGSLHFTFDATCGIWKGAWCAYVAVNMKSRETRMWQSLCVWKMGGWLEPTLMTGRGQPWGQQLSHPAQQISHAPRSFLAHLNPFCSFPMSRAANAIRSHHVVAVEAAAGLPPSLPATLEVHRWVTALMPVQSSSVKTDGD